MDAPPAEVGAVKNTLSSPFPGVIVPMVGAEGTTATMFAVMVGWVTV
jgi:hypothetical protein